MQLQRRDLFRATVAGFLAKFVGSETASRAADVADVAAEAVRSTGAKLTTIRERVHQPFRDTLIRLSPSRGLWTGYDDLFESDGDQKS